MGIIGSTLLETEEEVEVVSSMYALSNMCTSWANKRISTRKHLSSVYIRQGKAMKKGKKVNDYSCIQKIL